MMPCPRCGNLLVNGQTICDMCGVDVQDPNEVNQPLFNENPDGRQGMRLKPKPSPPQLIVPNEHVAQVEKPVSKRRYNVVVGVIIAVCALIIGVGVAGALYLFS